MKELKDRAMKAASEVVGEVTSVRHVESCPEGTHVFEARAADGTATVTLNPNGRAGVEYRHRTSGGGYRVLNLQGLVE